MSNTQLNKKYADTMCKLHTCSAVEKKALQGLLNYYYGLKSKRGLI